MELLENSKPGVQPSENRSENSCIAPGGILPVDKPEGLSSAQIVGQVKKHLKAKKVGHTGTLDPFATGLLLCGINQGTRISGFFLNSHKRYRTQIYLGIETDTYDLTGNIVFKADSGILNSLTKEQITKAILSFKGVQKQIPPAFSALKHKGRPLYDWARKGHFIQKPAREIEIFDISVNNIDIPTVELEIFCSAGTYIRSLGFDIGREIGCGAHLVSLCRTQSGAFHLKDAISLQECNKLSTQELAGRIIPIGKCIEFIPVLYADIKTAEKIKYGQKLFKTDFQSGFESGSELIDTNYSGALIRVMDSRNQKVLALVREADSGEEFIYSCVFAA